MKDLRLGSSHPRGPPSGALPGPAHGLGEGEYVMLIRRASARPLEGARCHGSPGRGLEAARREWVRGGTPLVRARARSYASIPEVFKAHAGLRRYFGRPRLGPRDAFSPWVFLSPLCSSPLATLFAPRSLAACINLFCLELNLGGKRR